ncbi:hypothetical protein DPSP01_013866 [Paraphaeosphaeria sporulosa]
MRAPGDAPPDIRVACLSGLGGVSASDKGGEIAVASLTAQTQARRLGATSTPLTHRYWCFSSPSIPSSFIDNIHSLALSDPAFAQCEPTAALCTLPPPHAGCARRTTRATLHCSCRGLRPNA